MRKIFLTALMAVSMPVFAQQVTPVNAPTAPTIPVTATVSPNAAIAAEAATSNSVFIDQSGENPNVNVEQTGTGNKMGSSTRPVYLRGRDQQVIVKQSGNSNVVNLEVVNPTTGVAVGAAVTIQQIGNNNNVDAACGYGTSSTGAALVGCSAADLNWKLTGNSNTVQFRGTGDGIHSAITVLGSTNAFFIDAIGNNHSETLMVSGDTNTFHISQTSNGVSGSSVEFDLTGSSNSATIQQSGSVDNVLNVKSVANTGTWNIKQGT